MPQTIQIKAANEPIAPGSILSKVLEELSTIAVGDLLKSSSPSIKLSVGSKAEFLSGLTVDALSDIPWTVAKPLSEQNFENTSSGSKFKYRA